MSTYAKYNTATKMWYLTNAHNGTQSAARGFESYRQAEHFAMLKGWEFVGLLQVLEANGFERRSIRRMSGFANTDQKRIAQIVLATSGVPHTFVTCGEKTYITFDVDMVPCEA